MGKKNLPRTNQTEKNCQRFAEHQTPARCLVTRTAKFTSDPRLLDFEFYTTDTKRTQEIGISTQDARDLCPPLARMYNILRTQNLRRGTGSKKHCLLFGEMKRIRNLTFEIKEYF